MNDVASFTESGVCSLTCQQLRTAEKLAPKFQLTFTKLSGEYSDEIFGLL